MEVMVIIIITIIIIIVIIVIRSCVHSHLLPHRRNDEQCCQFSAESPVLVVNV